MTTRHLKIDSEWVLGKNGKKLRYIFNKDSKIIILKSPSNWYENAFDDITDKYEGYAIKEDIVEKRGRPKLQRNDISDDFMVGDRVKSDNSLGIGIIMEIIDGKAKINFSNDSEIIAFCNIKKARGRKAKQKLPEEVKKEVKEVLLEILKHDGEMYLINNINEVMTMSGDYVGVYEDGEINNY